MPKIVTEAEEVEFLRQSSSSGVWTNVTFASGRNYDGVDATVARWLKANDYLEAVTSDDTALSKEDVHGSEF